MSSLFHDRFGKFSSAEGEVILDLLLLRREIAHAQVKLLVERSERRGQEFLLFRAVARAPRPQKVKEFVHQENTG